MTKDKKVFVSIILTLILLVMVKKYASAAIGSAHRLFSSGGSLFPPFTILSPRLCGSYGCGHFGASRDDGKRRHMGQDYLGSPGQLVFSPISGRIVSVGPAYASGKFPELKMVKISSGGALTINLMYVEPFSYIVPGYVVKAGEEVGTLQSLQKRYPGIPNHLHLEVLVFGVHVDPAPYFANYIKAQV